MRNICQSALLGILLEINRISPFASIGALSTALSFLQEDKIINAANRYFFIKVILKMITANYKEAPDIRGLGLLNCGHLLTII
jgi:hypothetical protein